MSNDSGTQIHPKHTPGPWEVSAETSNGKEYVPLIDAGPGNLPVAEANQYEPNAWGNAYLIAAAPDMYEALSSIENDDGSIPPAIWQMRNDALAKARGEL